MVQDICPEFKPQYHKKLKQNKNKKNQQTQRRIEGSER
jgi:hypothetical protein